MVSILFSLSDNIPCFWNVLTVFCPDTKSLFTPESVFHSKYMYCVLSDIFTTGQPRGQVGKVAEFQRS